MAQGCPWGSMAAGGVVVEPFQFFTSLILEESIGLRAATLSDLAKMLRTVPESCVYHHTHHFLFQHHYLTPEPANDFAYWASEVLGEESLGEVLADVDIMEHSTLESLRAALAGTVEAYLKRHPTSRFKFASPGEEFFFTKSIRVVMPTAHRASSLQELTGMLERVSIRSLYLHIFDARLRIGTATNDIALWVRRQLNLPGLADDIDRLDPYAHTLESLRATVLELLRKQLSRAEVSHG